MSRVLLLNQLADLEARGLISRELAQRMLHAKDTEDQQITIIYGENPSTILSEVIYEKDFESIVLSDGISARLSEIVHNGKYIMQVIAEVDGKFHILNEDDVISRLPDVLGSDYEYERRQKLPEYDWDIYIVKENQKTAKTIGWVRARYDQTQITCKVRHFIKSSRKDLCLKDRWVVAIPNRRVPKDYRILVHIK